MSPRSILALVLGCAATLVAALPQPFTGLEPAETAALARGESVFRQPSGWRDLSVPASAPFAAALIEETRRSGANYLGEVIAIIPRTSANEGLPALLASVLADLPSHVGIPYYSARNRATYPLYSAVKVLERSESGATRRLVAEIDMPPFERYRSSYSWTLVPAGVSFRATNDSHLSYKGSKAVSPGDLVWRLEAWAEGDAWILYGIGRVKAFDMLGLLRDRLSASFMGRIEAFYRYVFGKLR